MCCWKGYSGMWSTFAVHVGLCRAATGPECSEEWVNTSCHPCLAPTQALLTVGWILSLSSQLLHTIYSPLVCSSCHLQCSVLSPQQRHSQACCFHCAQWAALLGMGTLLLRTEHAQRDHSCVWTCGWTGGGGWSWTCGSWWIVCLRQVMTWFETWELLHFLLGLSH